MMFFSDIVLSLKLFAETNSLFGTKRVGREVKFQKGMIFIGKDTVRLLKHIT
jgi:hypothetical protein